MRDIILLAALLGVAPLMLRAPIVGLLAWIWITLMSPQREVYGFLSNFGLNVYVAVLTAGAWFASKDRKLVPVNLVTVGLLLFAGWTTVTTYTAFDRAFSLKIWDLAIKSIILALAVAALATTRARLQAVIWMIAVALGYYAVKGGGFVLLTGGRDHVYGAADSMIADNNALGVALIVLLPLLNYLRVTSRLASVRFGLLGGMALTVAAVIGTYSRGALITLAAAAATYAFRSRSGILVVLLGGVLAASLPALVPQGWLDRMATIQSADSDDSFMGRVYAWKASYNIAVERPLVGGGFYAVNLDWVAKKYSNGELKGGRAAHSIYFEVLGDHGFVGLGLFLVVLVGAWLNTATALALARGRPDLAWARELGRMLQVSLVAFLVGGSAVSIAYYDGALMLLSLTGALLYAVRQPAAATQAYGGEAAPRWKVLGEARATGQTRAKPEERLVV